MRIILSTFLATAFMATPLLATSAAAHDKAKEKASDMIKLPSEAQVEEIIDQLPDFNGMLGDLMKIAQDEELKEEFETSAKLFTRKLKKSGALETDENGLPNINAVMAVMLRSLADEDIMEPLLDTMDTLQDTMEKYIDDDGIPKTSSKTETNGRRFKR